MNTITILHLSDLQFGQNHRYPDGDASFNNLYEKLAEDLERLADQHQLRPNAIVVTGDVAEWSTLDEYAAAERFLEQLTVQIGIDRQHVVILPGNHDVNRKLCQGARLMAEGSGEPFEEPCFAKFGNYQRFFSISIVAACKTFLAYLSEEHRFLQMRGFGKDLRVPLELEPIYIALRAMPSHLERDACGDAAMETQGMQELEIGPALEFAAGHHYSGLVVLGDPGSGKTTLLKFLTLCLAQTRPVEETGVRPDYYPLYLPLRGVKDFDVTLEDALTTQYQGILKKLTADFFSRVLADTDQPCLVMLDGLDEVATPQRRTEALEWIEEQRKLYPGNLLLVTSRFAGYRGKTRLPENYLELHIRDFRKDDVRTFVRGWYRQVETRQRGDTSQWRSHATQQSDDLIRQLDASDSLFSLARNPLMLQIICLVHRTHGTMPKRRTELYEECVKVLLQKWDEAKGLEVYLSAAEARQVLRPLALWLHQEKGRTYAEEEDVKRVIRPHLARVKRETQAEAELQLDRVLTSVRDRSGLFVGFDVARYGFQHLSFQEFLAAEEIVKRDLASELVENFGRSWWREPTLLSLGMDDPRFQTSLFTQLIRSPRCLEHRDLALACVRESLAPCVTPFAEALADASTQWRQFLCRQRT